MAKIMVMVSILKTGKKLEIAREMGLLTRNKRIRPMAPPRPAMNKDSPPISPIR